MDNLIISMEATCEMPEDLLKKYDFRIIDMEYTISGQVYSTKNDDVVKTKLYERMKKGEKTGTSQINETQYTEFFDKLLDEGKEVLHIGFSSGLSGTYYSALSGAKVANSRHTNQVLVIDSLCGCAGQSLLAIMAAEFAKTAKNIDEVAAFVDKNILKINHTFSVDNLKYLVSGGRIKASTAFFGNLLNVKPIMKMDNNGKLCSCSKVLTRKRSLIALAVDCEKRADKSQTLCFVSHANCEADALFIKEHLEANSHLKPVITHMVPIIGSHSGPGTIAIFFLGDKR